MSTLTAVIRLGKDAEQRHAGSNTVTSFTGCFNTGYGDKQVATWINCSYWRKADGIIPYLKKGAQLEVTGECHLRSWESNGKSGVSLELNVDRIGLVGSNQSSQGNQPAPAQQPNQQGGAPVAASEDFDDDIPFNSLNYMIKSHLI